MEHYNKFHGLFCSFFTPYNLKLTGVCNGTNSTCIGCDGVPNSGLVFDACSKCGGDGTTCTALTTTVPQTIASGQPKVWVIGAGFNAGNATVCILYNPDSGVEVVNTTGIKKILVRVKTESSYIIHNIIDHTITSFVGSGVNICVLFLPVNEYAHMGKNLAIRAKKKRKTALNSRTWPKYCVLFNDVI